MSYRDSSNQSGDRSEATVMLDLIKKGWVILTPSSRDSVYDYVVDRGNGKFETIQVKTMSGNSICRIVDRSGEIVSANGKIRNSIDYAKHGIDWLVGVKKTGETFYYKHSTYSKIKTKSFSVNLHKQDGFPNREVPNRHARKNEKSS